MWKYKWIWIAKNVIKPRLLSLSRFFFLFFSFLSHGRVCKQLSGTLNCPGFFPLCQHNSMERVYQGRRFGWLIESRSVRCSLPFSFFLPLSYKPSLLRVFLSSLFSFFLIHSFLPLLPLPLSFIPSHTHPSAICAVKWDFRLHNVAWGFSFHIIPQADPKFFFFLSFPSHSLQPGAAERARERERKLLPYSRYWDGKWSQDRMCLPKPKENKQMAYVFMHWTPYCPKSCNRRTVAYNSFVVWDVNFHSKCFARTSHRSTWRCRITRL